MLHSRRSRGDSRLPPRLEGQKQKRLLCFPLVPPASDGRSVLWRGGGDGRVLTRRRAGDANASKMSLTAVASGPRDGWLPVKGVLKRTVIALGVVWRGAPLDFRGFYGGNSPLPVSCWFPL